MFSVIRCAFAVLLPPLAAFTSATDSTPTQSSSDFAYVRFLVQK